MSTIRRAETRVLYLTWDGPGQWYFETLFFPIFKRLRERGIRFDVLQCAWGKESELASTAESAHSHGIDYQFVRVAELSNLNRVVGFTNVGLRAAMAMRRSDYDVIMPRSILPAGVAMGALALARSQTPMVFDADGLMADERVDFGSMRATSRSYSMLRAIERRATIRASAVIVRTDRAKEILAIRAGDSRSHEKMFVAPNGRPADVFYPKEEGTQRAVDRPRCVYLGSLGAKYSPKAIGEFARAFFARFQHGSLVVATGYPEVARAFLPSQAEIVTLRPENVPAFLRDSDVGLALIAPTLSTGATSAIKVGEYLLSGVPVIAAGGVSDGARLAKASPLAVHSTNISETRWVEESLDFVERVMRDRGRARSEARALGCAEFGDENADNAYFDAVALATAPHR